MMACVADQIIAAPFAVLGSIGVIGQLPNLNRLLKSLQIDYELYTAGEYKRTLTLFGENTEKGREKFREEIEEIHALFKEFVVRHRCEVDIKRIATGEHWYGLKALELKLIDALRTSDDYLREAAQTTDLYEVTYLRRRSMSERLLSPAFKVLDRLYGSLGQR
jgi:serine protease SohB